MATEKYAGFWIRFAAYMIDAIVINIVAFIVGFVAGLFLGIFSVIMSFPLNKIITSTVGIFIGLLISWLYFSVMESSKFQGTLGKMAIGAVVVDEKYKQINFSRATGRYFSKILSSIILCIGYIMIGTDSKKQGLHDQLAGTYVVYKSAIMKTKQKK